MSTELAVTANNQARRSEVSAGTPVAMLRQSVAGSVDAVNDEHGPMVSKMAEEAGEGEVVEGSARIRIQPLDTRLRLHFKQTQVGMCIHAVYHTFVIGMIGFLG